LREKLVLLVEHENTILTVQQFLCLTFPSFGDFFLPFVSAFDARLQDVSFLFCDKFMSVGKLGDKLKKIFFNFFVFFVSLCDDLHKKRMSYTMQRLGKFIVIKQI